MVYTWDELAAMDEEVSEELYYKASNKELVAYGYDVVVPDTVTELRYFGCNNLVLPKTTVSVGYSDSLSTLYIKATEPPFLESGGLGDVVHLGNLAIVSKIGCSDAYKKADEWNLYADYITEGEMPQGSEIKQVISANIQQTPADWNQNDPEASDYIKNRTHYYEYSDTITAELSFEGGLSSEYIGDESMFYSWDEADPDEPEHLDTRWGFKPGEYYINGNDWTNGGDTIYVTEDKTTSIECSMGIIYFSESVDPYLNTNFDCAGWSISYYGLVPKKQLDAAFIPVDNNTIKVNSSGKLVANTTDTKNTTGATNTSSRIFLVGATSQSANPVTYTRATAYIDTDGGLYNYGQKVLTQSNSGFSLSSQGYPQIGYEAFVDLDADDSIAIGS
jgi:hypothetical protein